MNDMADANDYNIQRTVPLSSEIMLNNHDDHSNIRLLCCIPGPYGFCV